MEVGRCPKCSSENVSFSRRTSSYDCEVCHHVWNEQKPSGSLRIFLSYGHDANEELVRRIKADLEERGHDVWFDKNEIKFGDDWRRAITDGITGSNRVLSFLSKHSTRDPGVCRDEIAIAIGVKGGNIQTILVESEQAVQSPVNIGNIQWLDMHSPNPLLANPLRSVIHGGRERYLIVIDALDETGEAGRDPLVEMLARNSQRLPDWLGLEMLVSPLFPPRIGRDVFNRKSTFCHSLSVGGDFLAIWMSVTNEMELLGERLSRANSFEELAQGAVEVCAQVAGAEICTLWRVYVEEGGGRRLKLAAARGIDAPQTLAQEVTYAITPGGPAFDGMTGYVASERKEVLVHSFGELMDRYRFCHKGAMDKIQWKGAPNKRLRNLCAMPVLLGDELVAVLKVENKEGEGSFSEQDIESLRAVGQQIAIAAKVLFLLDAHERRLIDAPARLAKSLIRPFETDKLTHDIVDTTAETLDAEVCSLWLVDSSGRNLVHQAHYGFRSRKGEAPPPYRIDITPDDTYEGDRNIEGITAWVAIRRKAFWANGHEELMKHPSWRGSWDQDLYGGKDTARNLFRSMYALPLVWNNDLLGVLKVENPRNARYFNPTDRLKCDLMATYVVLLLALTRQLKLQLVPSMAHILQSPAVAIAVLLENIEKELKRPNPDFNLLHKWTGLIRRSALTLTVMSRTLSAEVGMRTGPQPLEDTELVGYLNRLVTKLKPLVPTDVHISIHLGKEPIRFPLTRSEQVWVEVILFNLVHNAIKYAANNTASSDGGRIELACQRQENSICISVSDNGPGISPEDLEHVFEPLYRKDAPGWPQGTGLGLFEVRRLSQQLGWSISLRNILPHGARFEVHVPAHWRQ